MYIIVNALKNMVRNKGRNSIAAVIIFCIMLTCVVSLAIYNSSKKIMSENKNKYGSEVGVELDFEKLQQSGKPLTEIPVNPPSQEQHWWVEKE